MILFIILGVIVFITFVVLGVLFYMLNKEGQKELSPGLLEPIISQKTEGHLQEANHLIETLTKENESLKSQQANLEQAQQKLIESTDVRMRFLEEEISRANATVVELNREKQALLSAPKPDSDEALRRELESLKYELVKARAQSSGLDRVSFNYKNQLEDFFRKINAVQVSNDHLSQVKNRLEGLVQEIKVQNEELVKKDQLAQFELEKHRSRLASLEREYEDFKARAQQKDQ